MSVTKLPLSVDHLPEDKRARYAAEPILSGRDLRITFGRVVGLDGVNLDLYAGRSSRSSATTVPASQR